MNSSPQPCSEFQELHLLEPDSSDSTHARDCVSCRQWLLRQEKAIGVLRAMSRLLAPAGLKDCVAADLELGNGALPEAFGSLERFVAPIELEHNLRAGLAQEGQSGDDTEISAGVELLGVLETRIAPGVLDRLVVEELTDLDAATTRRFAGDLFRKPAPELLSRQVSRGFGSKVGPNPRSVWRRAGLVSAASLLVVAGVLMFSADPPLAPRQFRVIEVTSLARLDPFARSLVGGLIGGKVVDVRHPNDHPSPRSWSSTMHVGSEL